MQPEHIVGLWHQFLATLHRVASETNNAEVLEWIPKTPVDPASVSSTLRSFFCVPMNCNAVNSLNCRVFTGPIHLTGEVQVNLEGLLSAFTGTGPSAQIWWPLLDLAEACNPVGVNADAARQHLHQYMPPGMVLNTKAPKPMNLENILNNVMTAIPHVQDTLTKVIHSTREDPNNMSTVIDHVHSNLLRPLLEGMGNQESLEPAVNKILDGFRGLSQAMQQSRPVDQSTLITDAAIMND